MRVALIKDGLVVNVVEAEPEVFGIFSGDYDAVVPSETAGIGWAYSQSEGFTAPPEESAPAAPAPISQLEFLRRFTAEERIGIRSSTDPVVVDFLHLLTLAQEVRLDDPDTVAGVHYLETAGLLAAGRADQILAA